MRAQSDYQSSETQAAELTLAANVVAATIHQADLRAQVELTEQMLQAETRQFEITEGRYGVGGISLQALQSQREQLEQLRTALAPLQAQRVQVDHLLAIYLGQTPAEAHIPTIRLSDIHSPQSGFPLTLPADLVRRRPDILAYEALWHEASARLGSGKSEISSRRLRFRAMPAPTVRMRPTSWTA